MASTRHSPPVFRGTALLGDIGGTHARFALFSKGRVSRVAVLEASDFAGPYPAIEAYLARQKKGLRIQRACLDVAGWIRKGRVTLTNGGWTLDEAEIERKFGIGTASLINDFEAIAWALPFLKSRDVYPLGGPSRGIPGQPIAAIGPGTGLGVGCILPEGRSWRSLAAEGGHASLPAFDERQSRVVEWLRKKFGHVSGERALSGDGLVNLYDAIRELDDLKGPDRSAAEVVEAALHQHDKPAVAALEMFCAFLGGFAGNLALTYGARGGVVVSGGIAPRFPEFLARSKFREHFEHKGRLSPFVAAIPTSVITHANPAMIGLAAYVTHQTPAKARLRRQGH
jgi:glucokinase